MKRTFPALLSKILLLCLLLFTVKLVRDIYQDLLNNYHKTQASRVLEAWGKALDDHYAQYDTYMKGDQLAVPIPTATKHYKFGTVHNNRQQYRLYAESTSAPPAFRVEYSRTDKLVTISLVSRPQVVENSPLY